MMKKSILLTLSITLTLISGFAFSEEQGVGLDRGIGGVESLRGDTELETTRPADPMKKVPRDQVDIESSYVFQPPLIPHHIRHYEISLNANKCLSCHSWTKAKQMGATKISVTHFVNRNDEVLADVSPRRYFCLQCHVTQADAKPLVGNSFERVKSLQ
ncbi:periplasmic nitrate reductase electron transfer subunit [Shewanella sp. Choline-02u-19]|uniref:nitrate reductase cytochrome c-type subunit n=1 Tax=unclassified Shewanella TaxID=196818 RepID=UPI000C3228DE|nr:MULTISPECIES: nitrate reductase cytochrome c-type subunit [unclassified Shewanella]PKH56889.1 periplasmic nitrate reductase electron transfer subunit [Shewanella sp. Bg11-22]PKI27686.1 periplasmic nitrate reductase electron transfer subunit [Shewanella sp. Choline-02u-19]